MDVRAYTDGIDWTGTAAEQIIAAQKTRASGDGFACGPDSEIHQFPARDTPVGELPGVQRAAEEIQFEVTVSPGNESFKGLANKLPGPFHCGIKDESVSPHARPAEGRKTVFRLGKHVRITLSDSRLRFDNQRSHPESRFKSQLRDPVRQIFHAVRKETVRLPFAVGILPAVIDDDFPDMFREHGIGGDEFGVFQNFVLGDRPAVVVPGVPARRGKFAEVLLFRARGVFRSIFAHQGKAVTGAECQGLQFDFPGRIVFDDSARLEVADSSRARRAGKERHERTPERIGESELFAVAGQKELHGAVKLFVHAFFQRNCGASAHLDPLGQQMFGFYGEMVKIEEFDIVAGSAETSAELNRDAVVRSEPEIQNPCSGFGFRRGAERSGGLFRDVPAPERHVFSVQSENRGALLQLEGGDVDCVSSGSRLKDERCVFTAQFRLFHILHLN